MLFIDNQPTLTLGVQSIDLTLLTSNIEGLANFAKLFGLPVVLTTTGGAYTPARSPIGENFAAQQA